MNPTYSAVDLIEMNMRENKVYIYIYIYISFYKVIMLLGSNLTVPESRY